MPAHIFHRVCDYASAAEVNERAAAVDRDYILKHKVQGIYAMKCRRQAVSPRNPHLDEMGICSRLSG